MICQEVVFMFLNSDVKYIKGVGEARAKSLEKLGIKTLGDMLTFYPRKYEDWSKTSMISECAPGEVSCVKAKVIVPPEMRRTKNGCLVKTLVSDSESLMSLTFFNNKYVVNQLHEGEEYLFYGKVTEDMYLNKEMLSPKFVPASKTNEQLRPVYRQNASLSSRTTERIELNALESAKGLIKDPLPDYIIKKYSFPKLYDSIYQMHFPSSVSEFKRAKERLIFEEFLYLQLGIGIIGSERVLYTAVRVRDDYTDEFMSRLPFGLTNAQKRCITECMSDMRSDKPMNRLLQGDVGSGKTAVAAALIYSAVKNGYQCALMAPTEVLACQHADSLSKLLGSEIKISLLTSAVKAKQKKYIKESLISGETDLLIGTHAIIQDSVKFLNLGLVITDEQHRFGVKQRAKLSGKGRNPHTLVMSATPIPRTLGLIVYGDLDVSIIDELPEGRTPVETYLVTSSYRERICKFIRKHVAEGRQVYVVCPLIDENEDGADSLISAKEYYEKLKNEVFSDLNVGLLHGRMKNAEKDEIMKRFSAGEINILVSTVVIEVGIDVPNAALMVIENADRFGLSQLHQLRGRIGRGQYKSTCILVSDSRNDETKRRLSVICKTNDGFKIADEDLKLRGPGDFLGERQHGLPEMKLASLTDDTGILFEAKNEAERILSDDKKLEKDENKLIKGMVDKMFASLGSGGLN